MKLRSILALVVSFSMVFAPAVSAAGPEAMGRLSAEGAAKINGVAMPTGTTVYDGDRISAGQKSMATITLTGGNRILVAENSQAQVRKVGTQMGVSIEQGGLGFAQLKGEPVLVEALGVILRPVGNGPVSYMTKIESKSLVLTAVKGDVRVEGRNSSHVVPAGKTMRFELGESTAAPQGPAGAGGNSFASAKAVIITAIIIGAALSIALPLALGDDDSVSP